jgi:dTDP-D-glucose 4,6-dehydratase
MKIIFLDIDGVLNTFGDKELINNIFEKKKLERIINLSNETHPKIIITSDRRIHSDERIVIDNVFDKYNALIDY